MLSAFLFYTILFLALVAVPAGLIFVVLLLMDRRRRLWQRVATVLGPVGATMAQGLAKLGFRRRFPRTADFLVRRLDAHHPWGLPAMVAGLGILLGFWFFLGVLQDIVAKDPLVVLNIRLHNAMPLFRTAGMSWFMFTLTQLGSAAILFPLCLGIALLALARQQRRIAITFLLALAGTGLLSAVLKALFGYARPMDGIVSVRQASFPSGHTLSGTVVYGLLAALLLSSRVRRGWRAVGIALLLLIIVGIGLSRLYLGLHWPSDILGSLALAIMVLASLMFFMHYDRPVRGIDTFKLPMDARVLRMTGSAVLLIALGATALLTSRMKMLPIRPPSPAQSISIQVLQISLPADLSRWSEDLIGGRMEPISLVFVGSEEDLVRVFTRAGWLRADPPTPLRVMNAVVAALRNLPDPAAPLTPAFFADRPQNIAFEKSEPGSPNLRQWHHARLWQTAYCLAPNCRPVWVATAGSDAGIERSQRLHHPPHRMDPALDPERALVTSDLLGVGATQPKGVLIAPTPNGTNAVGEPFPTDGRAVVLVFPQALKAE